MSNKKMSDALASRSPLGRREAVAPVNMYQQPQVDKTTGDATEMTANPQNASATNGQTGKSTKPQVEKYTTHLRPETIKAVKRAALDRDRKDYEIVQAALDAYLRRE